MAAPFYSFAEWEDCEVWGPHPSSLRDATFSGKLNSRLRAPFSFRRSACQFPPPAVSGFGPKGEGLFTHPQALRTYT